jgi:hypothetical protein
VAIPRTHKLKRSQQDVKMGGYVEARGALASTQPFILASFI